MARKRRTPPPPPPLPPSAASSPSAADLLASPAGRKRTNKRALLDPVLSPPVQKKARSMQTRSSSRREAAGTTVAAKFATFFSRSVDTTPPETAPLVTIQPDPHLPHPYRHEARVVQVRGVIYDAMLTRACVHENQSEFIALQALEHNRSYFLSTRAGHVGYSGKIIVSGPFASQHQLLQEFCSLFTKHTTCAWDQRYSVGYREGSYTWIELDYSMGTPYSEALTSVLAENQGVADNAYDDDDDASYVLRSTQHRSRLFRHRWLRTSSSARHSSSSSTSASTAVDSIGPPSKLHGDVQTLVRMLANPSVMEDMSRPTTIPEETLGDQDLAMPLGRLSKTTIKRGYESLQQIYEALRKRSSMHTALAKLSSHFYSIIPHHSHLEVIDCMLKLGKKVALMETLCANVRGMTHVDVVRQCRERNYLDECYGTWACDLQPVDERSREYELVSKYLTNSDCCGWKEARVELVSVFRVDKAEEQFRYEPFSKYTNRRMLWHGSSLLNWKGILSEGLRIAPPEVPSHGHTFGKGIYFTDKLSKALSYCQRTSGSNKSVLVLSEVALGETKELLGADSAARNYVQLASATSSSRHRSSSSSPTTRTFHSCKGVGSCQPDANGDIIDSQGTIWPLGTAVHPDHHSTGLYHNEFIIYNPAQARMRYLVVTKSSY